MPASPRDGRGRPDPAPDRKGRRSAGGGPRRTSPSPDQGTRRDKGGTPKSSGTSATTGGNQRKDDGGRRYGRGPVRGTGAGRAGAPVKRGKTSARGSGTPKRRPPPQPVPVADQPYDEEGVRLQKLLAGAGLGSRRACERLIEEGRVQVDGVVVTELGTRIMPAQHTVHVDGDRVQLDTSTVYLALNKPAGVLSTMSDDQGRPSLGDIVGERRERLFHVGRLDQETDGLLLLTNDGDLAHRLQHPSYEVPKTYVAQVRGLVPKGIGRTLREGVELEDGVVRVDSFKLLGSRPGHALVEVVLHEGRKHVVRRLLDAVGYPVETLTRVQVGPVRLGDLKAGRTRVLTREEVAGLYGAAGL